MSSAFTETLHTWQNFYFMTGGAAATMIGLLFVALSLGWHLVSPENDERFDNYITPILIYFISVLLLACMMLVPAYPAFGLSLLLLGLGILGDLEIVRVTRGMLRLALDGKMPWGHWFFNVISPGLGYVLIVIAAVWLAVSGSVLALYLVALADVVLLVNGIWRSWEIVVWVAHQRRPE